MPKYCDSVQLERNWFYWLLSSSVPQLEPFRQAGVLWTRIDSTFADPQRSHLEHCIAIGAPHCFNSVDGTPDPTCMMWHNTGVHKSTLPFDIIDLESDSSLLRLDEPWLQQMVIVPRLRECGFLLEIPTNISWSAMIKDIELICVGVARKFKPSTDEELYDLAHESLRQVMEKLTSRKLVYTPGRAPVFNLLTTTIYRCICSIKNRSSKQHKNTIKLANDLRAGVLPQSSRSLRMYANDYTVRTTN